MKLVLFLIFLLLCRITSMCQPSFYWEQKHDTSYFTSYSKILTDANGNIYQLGIKSVTGESSMILKKYNQYGNLFWVKSDSGGLLKDK